jgi:uncharacterized membrane protein YeaQ/YmgE (transglycosylase-associated protein family)
MSHLEKRSPGEDFSNGYSWR